MLELPNIPVELEAVTRYGGAVRPLVRLLKQGNPAALEKVAREMAELVPEDSVIIPMPTSRKGKAVRDLAIEVADLSGSALFAALVRTQSIPRSHLLRRAGKPGHDISIHLLTMKARPLPAESRDRQLVVVDDVITSGASMLAAERLLGRKILGVVYADASRR